MRNSYANPDPTLTVSLTLIVRVVMRLAIVRHVLV